jgi:hypothetical protein
VFKALLWKEWRQLRGLRRAGVAIGMLTPPGLLVLAEAAERGWLFAEVSQADSVTVIQTVTPGALMLAIWPLLALMATAQAFCADRAGGTEGFLLSRPVRRSKIWLARLTASLGSTAVMVAGGLAFWWLLVRIAGRPVAFEEWATVGRVLGTTAGTATLATLSAAAAAPFVRTPMQAVLLGGVLAFLPVGAALVVFDGMFPSYRLAGVRIGLGLPVLLVAGYAAGSFAMECRGEPAGRGRMRRGLPVLAIALVSMPVVLAVSAPMVLRWDARMGLGNTSVLPSPEGDGALVMNLWQRAAWLVDTGSARPVRFLAPPVFDGDWSPDGTRLAVLHAGGPAGRVYAEPRIDVFDAAGQRTTSTLDCPGCRAWWGTGMFWIDDTRLALPGFTDDGDVLRIVNVETGAWTHLPVPAPFYTWKVMRPADTREIHVARFVRRTRDRGQGPQIEIDLALHRLDATLQTLGEPVELENIGSAYFAQAALSPSGRYWLRLPASKEQRVQMIELATGDVTEINARRAVWMAGDTPVWISADGTQTLWAGRPGRQHRVHQLPRRGAWLQPSFDGRRLLVRLLGDRDSDLHHAIYELESGRWIDTEVTAELSSSSLQWAGANRLAVVEQGALSLYDPGTGERRAVIGRPAS